MATKEYTVREVTCDITGEALPEDTPRIILSVSGLNAAGEEFEHGAVSLELSDGEKAKLVKALQKYFRAGTPFKTTAPRSSASNPETAAIRAWAQSQGKNISDKGRIPNQIVEEYHAAVNGNGSAPQEANN